jgi:hypothetical protein
MDARGWHGCERMSWRPGPRWRRIAVGRGEAGGHPEPDRIVRCLRHQRAVRRFDRHRPRDAQRRGDGAAWQATARHPSRARWLAALHRSERLSDFASRRRRIHTSSAGPLCRWHRCGRREITHVDYHSAWPFRSRTDVCQQRRHASVHRKRGYGEGQCAGDREQPYDCRVRGGRRARGRHHQHGWSFRVRHLGGRQQHP